MTIKCFTTAALISVLSFSGAEAQSCADYETLVNGNCVYDLSNIIVGLPNFFENDEDVPNFQNDDQRDEEWGSHGGSGGPDPGDTQVCSSTETYVELITLSETDDFLYRQGQYEDWRALLSGTLVGILAASVPEPHSTFSAPLLAGSVYIWLRDNLNYGPIHCGDRVVTRTSICIDTSIPPGNPLSPPLGTRSVDTYVQHLHFRCIDDYDGVIRGEGDGYSLTNLRHSGMGASHYSEEADSVSRKSLSAEGDRPSEISSRMIDAIARGLLSVEMAEID